MKKLIVWFTLFVSIAGPAVAAEPRVLRAGMGLNIDTAQGKAFLRFGEIVQERTQGRIKVEVYPSGKLGSDVEMINKLRAGELDISAPDSSTLSKYVSDLSAINYPFTFLNEAEADAILDGEWGQRLLARLPAHGLIATSYWENGFRHLTNSKQPISDFRNVSGVKVRVMQNPMLLDSFKSMGFEAFPMPFPAVYQALAKKEVDAQENPLATILSSKFYEVQNYLTLSRHVYSAYVFLISKKVWDSLPEADRKVLADASVEMRLFQRTLNRQMNAFALDQLKAKGMQVSSIDVKEAESIRRRLRDVLDRYNRDIGEASVISMYVALSQMRAAELTTKSNNNAVAASLAGSGAAGGKNGKLRVTQRSGEAPPVR